MAAGDRNNMKMVRVLALITLGFLGVTSLMGGIPMILDPSGGMLHMPLSLLAHSPFHSFLIPGIVLSTANGALSVVVFVTAVRRVTGYGNFVALQGFAIAGWITVEVVLLRPGFLPPGRLPGVLRFHPWSVARV